MERLKLPAAVLAICLACVVMGCAAAAVALTADDGSERAAMAAYAAIHATLERVGPVMDYDTLMAVYQALTRPGGRVARMDQLLRRMVAKRNPEPRVDQMILIFAARIMGQSRHPIDGAQEIFEQILRQKGRTNSWVIAFLAEAVGDYPFDLPRGAQLVDEMERELARLRAVDSSGQEHFGFHFLPPPKSPFIQNYINGIAELSIRQSERNTYYRLIQNKLTEPEIEPALKFLQAHGMPDTGEKCPRLLECLMRCQDQLPFEPR